MPFGTEVGIGPGDIVLDDDPASAPHYGRWTQLPKKENGVQQLPTSQTMYRGQRAGWIKMPFGTEIGLGPGNSALDGDPAPPRKRGHASNFRPMLVVAKRLDR